MEKMLLLLLVLINGAAAAQWFAGGTGGISTLSGDGASRVEPDRAATAQYQPKIGLAAQGFAGRQFGNYLGLQAAFSWNRNQVTFVGVDTSGAGAMAFEQERQSSQRTAGIDGLIYFRKRGEIFRPYVSVGAGWLHLSSDAGGRLVTSGAVRLPAARFSAQKPYWRTAVGLDLAVKPGWRFRYTFWETVSANPFSSQLRPQGKALLLNFLNQFGFVREF